MASATEMLVGENTRLSLSCFSNGYVAKAKAALSADSVCASSAGTCGSTTRASSERAAVTCTESVPPAPVVTPPVLAAPPDAATPPLPPAPVVTPPVLVVPPDAASPPLPPAPADEDEPPVLAPPSLLAKPPQPKTA